MTALEPETPRPNPPTTHTRTGAAGARYDITVAAHNGTAWSHESASDAAVCASTAPTGLRAECSAEDAELAINWNPAAISETYLPIRTFEVEIDGQHTTEAVYFPAEGPTKTYTYPDPTPNHTHTIKVRERAAVSDETANSPWAQTTEHCDRWIPRNVEASCNSHGVVTLKWDHTDDATEYQTIGITYRGQGGTGNQRLVHAQRQEGETHEFQVQAHTAGDWGDPSQTETAICDPLGFDAPGYPDWQSPHGYRESGCVLGNCVNRWVNPSLDRYVLSPPGATFVILNVDPNPTQIVDYANGTSSPRPGAGGPAPATSTGPRSPSTLS